MENPDNMAKWSQPAANEAVGRAMASLKANGFDAILVGPEQAKEKIISLLPQGAEVMTMTSTTLDELGVTPAINDSGKFDAVKAKFNSMDWKSQAREMRKMGAGPDYVIGSVHAVTEDGQLLVASATGSQLPGYAYGGGKVIFVVGTQKIVEDLDEAFRRVREYTLPLEDARARKAYGSGSGLNKFLILSKEVAPGRITVVFVPRKLGF